MKFPPFSTRLTFFASITICSSLHLSAQTAPTIPENASQQYNEPRPLSAPKESPQFGPHQQPQLGKSRSAGSPTPTTIREHNTSTQAKGSDSIKTEAEGHLSKASRSPTNFVPGRQPAEPRPNVSNFDKGHGKGQGREPRPDVRGSGTKEPGVSLLPGGVQAARIRPEGQASGNTQQPPEPRPVISPKP